MSSFKNVYDVMKEASSKMAHNILYKELIDGEGAQEMLLMDMVNRESKALSQTEVNILSGLECQDKFTKKGMADKGMMVNVLAVAKSNSSNGRSEITNSKRIHLDYKAGPSWLLSADRAYVRYSQRNATLLAKDESILAKVKSACANMSDGEIGELNIAYAVEKMTRRSDMRHLLTKAYLMLMDLNLSGTSKSEVRRVVRQLPLNIAGGMTGAQRLGAIVRYDIVVDTEGFTEEEMELLIMSAQAYPAIKFGSDNVYTACNLESDSLLLLSANQLDRKEPQLRWTPDSLYRLIISVACKLDCIDDWWEVVTSMRGRPFLMRDVMLASPDRRVNFSTPKSHSCQRALGGTTDWKTAASRMPGFLSATVSLISDALMGEALILGATCVIEQMGGIGKVICAGNPYTDSLYASTIRDYGINTMSLEHNTLLMMWSQICDIDYKWGLPRGYTDYILKMTDMLRNGWDVKVPQLAHDTPYVLTEHSTWGVLRGWEGTGGFEISMTKDQRDRRMKVRAAFTWAMGVRKTRPRVFANNEKKGEEEMTMQEHEWLAGVDGLPRLTRVVYTLAEDVGGRIDDVELEASALIRSAVKGSRCSVFHVTGTGWSVDSSQYIPEKVEESSGFLPPVMKVLPEEKRFDDEDDDIKPITVGGSAIRPNDKSVFSGLTATVKPRHVAINIKPRFTGEVEYELEGGEVVKSIEPRYGRPIVEGDTIKVARVKIPGDNECGLHAMAKSMNIKGMVGDRDVERIFRNFDNMADPGKWESQEQLGTIAVKYGMKLRVVRQDEDGLHVTEYGEGPSVDIMAHEGKYAPVILSGLHGSSSVVRKIVTGEIVSEGSESTGLAEFQKFFQVRG